MCERILTLLGSKLGIEQDSKLLRKAEEYKRLISLKPGLATDETTSTVLCLDIASTQFGSTFDRVTGAKLCRMTKPVYLKSLHSFEKLLGLENKLTVSSLTIKLGVMEIAQKANDILKGYKSEIVKSECGIRDLDHPVYICASVKAASKITKTPIDRNSLVELCHMRTSQLDKIAGRMMEIYNKVHGCHDPLDTAQSTRRTKKKKDIVPKGLLEAVEESVKDSERKSNVMDMTKDDVKEQPSESLEDWKKRILNS